MSKLAKRLYIQLSSCFVAGVGALTFVQYVMGIERPFAWPMAAPTAICFLLLGVSILLLLKPNDHR